MQLLGLCRVLYDILGQSSKEGLGSVQTGSCSRLLRNFMLRYTNNPSSEHWTTLHQFLRYLRGTMDRYLHFSRFPVVLEGYYDVNWVKHNDEVSSTSGYAFTLGEGAISWKSSKQTYIARPTMESEFFFLELEGKEME